MPTFRARMLSTHTHAIVARSKHKRACRSSISISIAPHSTRQMKHILNLMITFYG